MAHFDDNARTGLHALALGALIIGVPVLVVQLVDLWQTVGVTTDAHLLHIFRNGYLLPMNGPQLTCDTTTRMERIGLAAAFALPVGALLGMLSAPLRKVLSPFAVGRWSAFAAFLFLLWCSLTTPVRSVNLVQGGLVIVERPALLGSIALPWNAVERRVNTTGATLVTEPVEAQRTGVLLVQGEERSTIATTRAGGPAVEAATQYLDRILN
jgi:hypothetical protein